MEILMQNQPGGGGFERKLLAASASGGALRDRLALKTKNSKQTEQLLSKFWEQTNKQTRFFGSKRKNDQRRRPRVGMRATASFTLDAPLDDRAAGQ
jgi:hypothetical protein